MKQLLILLVSALPLLTSAQWETVNSNTSNTLWGIASLNIDTLVAVGSYGKIVRTTDNGDTWTTIDPPDHWAYNTVTFITPSIGICIGEFRSCARTTDGGETWTTIMSLNNSWYNKIKFHDEMNGYIIGTDGFIRRSSDAGASWPADLISNLNTDNDLKDLDFSDGNKVHVVGENGFYAYSTDEGMNWTSTSITSGTLRGIEFITDDLAIIVGDGGEIWNTVNGGQTWTNSINPTTNHLNSVAFSSIFEGYACGTSGTLLKTTNAGATWDIEPSVTNAPLFDLAIQGNEVYCSGAEGVIIRSTTTLVGQPNISSAEKAKQIGNKLILPKPANIILMNTAGQIVLESYGKTVDLSPLTNGIYLWLTPSQSGKIIR